MITGAEIQEAIKDIRVVDILLLVSHLILTQRGRAAALTVACRENTAV